jgi:PAS domain S-box-containing protein
MAVNSVAVRAAAPGPLRRERSLPLSQLPMTGGRPRASSRLVPSRALAVSLAALGVPVVSALFLRESLAEYRALLWVLALIPAFLLAHYRGWRGVAAALGAGMTAITFFVVVQLLLGNEVRDWPLFLFVVAPYIAIALGAGWGSGVMREVTVRLRAEVGLRRLEKAIETIELGVCVTDPAGTIVYSNPAYAAMHGYAVAELVGSTTTGYEPSEGTPDAPVGDGAAGRRWEGVNLRKDGTTFPASLTTSVVRNPEGDRVGRVMTCEDVTERRVLEAQLRQAQKMEAVGQLTGGIAHDFKNLLTVIQANADLAHSSLAPEQGDLRDDLDELRSAARRGADMIQKLLGFSRRAELSFRPVNLTRLATDLFATLRRLLPAHIEIRVLGDEQAPVTLADRGAIEQVFMNLATNARDAMPKGVCSRSRSVADGWMRSIAARTAGGSLVNTSAPW